ncbi:uncharacterized protein DEA37_0011188, partial [Paragonimus westermani]
LKNVFCHEDVPAALFIDSSIHFTTKSLERWIKGRGCRYLFTAPRNSQSNGLAEESACTLKSVIASLTPESFVEFNRGVVD